MMSSCCRKHKAEAALQWLERYHKHIIYLLETDFMDEHDLGRLEKEQEVRQELEELEEIMKPCE